MRLFTNLELSAAATLSTELDEHLEACHEILPLIEDCVAVAVALPESSSAVRLRVGASLLIRLAQEIRGTLLLNTFGYPTQATSIVAGAFETAYTVAYIRDIDDRARSWLGHDDPTRPYKRVKLLIRDVLQRHGIDDEQVDAHYRIYQQLCLAKHGNPLFAQDHSFQQENGKTVVTIGPNTSEAGIRAAEFSLVSVPGLATVAIRSFLADYVGNAKSDLEKRLMNLETKWTALHEQGSQRWGTEDPFPGKW